MKVAEIMTRPVISVTPDTTIAEAARLMLQHRISGLPVVAASGEVVGILTEGDLLRRAETGTQLRRARWLEFLIAPGRLAREYANAHARRVGEVMTPRVECVGPETELAEVVRLLERRRIKRLPVTDAGQLVGIVSRANLVRALVHNLPKQPGREKLGDDQIRERILAEIANQPWGPRASVDVRVKDGAVDFYGTITDERERNALRIVAENTAGVSAVHDHLVWVEPVSGFVIPAEGSQPVDAA